MGCAYRYWLRDRLAKLPREMRKFVCEDCTKKFESSSLEPFCPTCDGIDIYWEETESAEV